VTVGVVGGEGGELLEIQTNTEDIPSLCIQLSVVTVGVEEGEGGELPEIQTILKIFPLSVSHYLL
jgi:hypothetical protein